jgi:predicted ATP-dependent endonuclease of OLD family
VEDSPRPPPSKRGIANAKLPVRCSPIVSCPGDSKLQVRSTWGTHVRFTKFEIHNYKGITFAAIDIPPEPAPIIALIGLNESGKTTVLEGISQFTSEDGDVSALFPMGNKPENTLDFIPKAKKANFSGQILFRAHIQITELDISAICAEARSKHKLQIQRTSLPREIAVTRNLAFTDSTKVKSTINWPINFKAKKESETSFRKIEYAKYKQEWLQVVNIITDMLPQICFFPSFLFDFPDRIYLKRTEDEDKVQRAYRNTISDVLRSADRKLSLEKHITERIDEFQQANSENWRDAYEDSNEKKVIDAAIEKIEAEIGKVVFTDWNKIFQKSGHQTVSLQLRFDSERDGAPFLVFSLRDGLRKYELSERSMGFRWFFSFLLFTRFRRARQGVPAVFLFDEPASNLHARAQAKLLESFTHILRDNSAIIYSTHSPHMIDPIRLDNSYIIQNTAIDFQSDNPFDSKDTDIKAIKYRTFVGKNPDKGSYFQPVLDKIAVVQSPLEMPHNVLILEGKGDFFLYSTFIRRLGFSFRAFPSAGATTIGVQIAQCLGLGKNFAVLCDDDTAGRKARDTYRKEFHLRAERVITYADLNAAHSGYRLEQLLTQPMTDIIEAHFGAPFEKVMLTRFFQEACVNDALAIAPCFETTMRSVLESVALLLNA